MSNSLLLYKKDLKQPNGEEGEKNFKIEFGAWPFTRVEQQ